MKLRKIEKREDGSVRVATINSEPSLTQQHFKDQCDVNKIIAKFKKTGEFTHVAKSKGVYADLSSKPDYLTAMTTVTKANQAFMNLPAKIRQRFGHDPAQLLSFLSDPKNTDEAIKLGLAEKKASPMVPPSGGSQPEGGQSEKKDK